MAVGTQVNEFSESDRLFDAGRLRGIVDYVFLADRAEGASDHMAGSGKFGKVLVAF